MNKLNTTTTAKAQAQEAINHSKAMQDVASARMAELAIIAKQSRKQSDTMQAITDAHGDNIAEKAQNAVDNKSIDMTAAIDTLSRIACYGVLRRLESVSDGNMIDILRRDLTSALTTMDKGAAASMADYDIKYDKRGKITAITHDTDAEKALNNAVVDNYGVAIDMYQTAYTTLWEYVADGLTLDGVISVARRRGGKGRGVVDTQEITVYQAAWRAVRGVIRTEGATVDKYKSVYIEDCTDAETGELIYKRLPRYSDLGAFCTAGGLDAIYTADETTVEDYTRRKTVLMQGFTTAQRRLLALRERGYSLAECAEKLGISDSTVRTQAARMREKAMANINGNGELFRYRVIAR